MSRSFWLLRIKRATQVGIQAHKGPLMHTGTQAHTAASSGGGGGSGRGRGQERQQDDDDDEQEDDDDDDEQEDDDDDVHEHEQQLAACSSRQQRWRQCRGWWRRLRQGTHRLRFARELGPLCTRCGSILRMEDDLVAIRYRTPLEPNSTYEPWRTGRVEHVVALGMIELRLPNEELRDTTTEAGPSCGRRKGRARAARGLAHSALLFVII